MNFCVCKLVWFLLLQDSSLGWSVRDDIFSLEIVFRRQAGL